MHASDKTKCNILLFIWWGRGVTDSVFVSTDYKGNLQRLAFVQYAFDKNEHPIHVKPHGNSKGKTPFRRTKPSTLQLVKKGAQSKPARHVLADIENQMGGVSGAKAGCDLPRNRQQIYNAKKFPVSNKGGNVPLPGRDTLAEVMRLCKETVTTDQAFIRCVEAAPEPLCVLATNQQIKDLERFCTADSFCVLSVDPTFNLGPFFVTPLTYSQKLTRSKRGTHPLLLGPVLIHQTKTFHAFYYFASTLVHLNPKLKDIRAFGTDGEVELIKAFQMAFTSAVHLRCTNHMKQNVKDKLYSLGMGHSTSKAILTDVFGTQFGTHLVQGLIDAESASTFWTTFESLKEKWNIMEMSVATHNEPQFHSWFMKREIISCVLPEVRIRVQTHQFLILQTAVSQLITSLN